MTTNPRPKVVVPPRSTSKRSSHLTVWAISGGLCLLVLAGTYFLFVEKPPPRRITIATGGEGGAYYHFARQYAELLQKDGITLEVRATKGSVENLDLLADPKSGVGVAIVQSGVADDAAASHIAALGSLYREPLWIFYRGDQPLKLVSQLEGKRLAIGPPGSGTRVTALQVLQANGLASGKNGTTLLEQTGEAAVKDLKTGQVDAVFLVASVEAPYVLELMKTPGVRLLSMKQHEAYLRNYRYLSRVTVPAGLVDLGKNLPDRDIDLIGPNAVLVVRNDFHPDLVGLLLAAATKVHGPGSRLAQAGEFPSASGTGLPVHPDASHYLKSGPSFLHRFLPFGVASLVDRLKIMLIPLVMLMMPLLRLTPPLVRWRTRRKIYLWYGLLRDIDEKLIAGATVIELQHELFRLREIEDQVAAVDVPLSFMGEFHNMRFHLSVVLSKLERLLAEKKEAVEPAHQT
jgi:TRAP transporter TAXI family solute receptor